MNIARILDGLVGGDNLVADDYFDAEGYLLCGKCDTRKQYEVVFNGQTRRVPVMCACRKIEYETEQRELGRQAFLQRMETLRKDGITDPAYLHHTFANDDYRDKGISDICRRYVDTWEEMKTDNIGILFYGSVGTGKSFLACAIANALLEKCVPVCVTNFPKLLNKLQGFGERQELIDRHERYSLLVIDDLGVERDTSYSVEQVYNVIDARARAKKPLIITTNLSMDDLKGPPSLEYSRIYDRVLEMCPIRLVMKGDSRRAENADKRRDRAKRILAP